MAEIKCSRCDRRYSSLRSRCPYCGTRRNSRGKRVAESDNSLWKLVVGVLILLVLLVAVIVLIVSAVKGNGDAVTKPSASVSPSYDPSGGVSSVVDPSEVPTETPPVSPTETPTPTLSVESVAITYSGSKTVDFTMKVGESLKLGFKTVPESAAASAKTVVWASSNEDIFLVTQEGKVTAVGKGNANLTVTVDGVVSTVTIVRVK